MFMTVGYLWITSTRQLNIEREQWNFCVYRTIRKNIETFWWSRGGKVGTESPLNVYKLEKFNLRTWMLMSVTIILQIRVNVNTRSSKIECCGDAPLTVIGVNVCSLRSDHFLPTLDLGPEDRGAETRRVGRRVRLCRVGVSWCVGRFPWPNSDFRQRTELRPTKDYLVDDRRSVPSGDLVFSSLDPRTFKGIGKVSK